MKTKIFSRVLSLAFIALAMSSQGFCQSQTYPIWWLNGVLSFDNNNTTDNWAIANIGQLKNIATQAKAHLDGQLGLSASDWDTAYGGAVNNPFPFSTAPDPENYGPALIGQVKFIASGFYNILYANAPWYDIQGRLNGFGANGAISGSGPYYPWVANSPSTENWSPVTIGQLKMVFSFDLAPTVPLTLASFGAAYNPVLQPIAPTGNFSVSVPDTTIDDTIVQYQNATASGTQFQIMNTGSGLPVTFSNFSSSDPAVATVNSAGQVLWPSGGTGGTAIISFTVTINYGTSFGFNASLPVTMTETIANQGSSVFVGHVASSLAEQIQQQLDAILPGYTPNATPQPGLPLYATAEYYSQTDRFSTWTGNTSALDADLNDPAQQLVALNPSNFLTAAGIDTSCIPVTSYNGFGDAGCLVTPRHVLYAAHLDPILSSYIYFLGTDNAIYRRTVTKITNMSNLQQDLVILTLDSDLPSVVHPAHVMPDNAALYLPEIYSDPGSLGLPNGSNWIPCISVHNPIDSTTDPNYQRHFISTAICDSDGAPGSTDLASLANLINNDPANYGSAALEESYYVNGVRGDSGHPSFFLINDQLVALCVFFGGGSEGSGPSVQQYHDAINQVLGQDGNYSLSDVDLSGFPTY